MSEIVNKVEEKVVEATTTEVAKEVVVDAKGETDNADIASVTSMLKSMGTESETKPETTSADANAAEAPKEELQLLRPFESHVSELMFTDPVFKIPEPILDALTIDMNKIKPFKIQASTLPYILNGRNIIAQAQAGAGKTLAFVIGMLSRIDTNQKKLQAICLSPTRELAVQIMTDAIDKLKTRMDPPVRSEVLLAGTTIVRNSKSGAHIMVSTPGKAVEAFTKKYISLKHVKVFVLDEADTMVSDTEKGRDLGSDANIIRAELPPTCQLMFFSATYKPEIFQKAREMVPRAVTFKLASDDDLMMEKIFKVVIDVSTGGGKMKVLKEIYSKLSMQQSIVFVEQKTEADSVAHMMNSSGYEVSCLHADLKGADRDVVMQRFRDSQSRVLITTNVLARGVDVPSVACVINFDLPVDHTSGGGVKGRGMVRGPATPDYTTFVHRIGRTGRGEKAGTAISFIDGEADKKCIADIDHYFSASKADNASGSSGFKSMFTFWDANDITGLVKEIQRRQIEREDDDA